MPTATLIVISNVHSVHSVDAAPCMFFPLAVVYNMRSEPIQFATTRVMLTPVGKSSNSPVYRVHGSRFRKVEEAVAEDVAKLCS